MTWVTHKNEMGYSVADKIFPDKGGTAKRTATRCYTHLLQTSNFLCYYTGFPLFTLTPLGKACGSIWGGLFLL